MKEELVRPIFRFFNSRTKNAEIYINNGSVWLIFTNEKKWVFELTKEGTLWYNYYFFENILKYFSLEVVKNEDYITKWVENFIRNGVKDTTGVLLPLVKSVDDTIQNGVKHTARAPNSAFARVEYTIQNGVKETFYAISLLSGTVENTIQNGVKETKHNPFEDGLAMEEAIHNGVKEIKELPDKSGMLLGYGEYYARREDKTYPHTDLVNKVIRDSIEETKYCELHSLMRADHIIRDGIKETHWKRVDNHPTFVDSIIQTKNPS